MRVFFFLNAKTKTEGGESYLQFGASIKMQIVGNHFSAVTMEALSLRRLKTARRIGPTPDPQLRILYLQTQRRGATAFFFCKMALNCVAAVSLAAQEQMLDWPHVWQCHCWREELSKVCQSIRGDKASLREIPWGTGVLRKRSEAHGENILLTNRHQSEPERTFVKTCSHEVRMKCFITYFTSHFVGILNLF